MNSVKLKQLVEQIKKEIRQEITFSYVPKTVNEVKINFIHHYLYR